MRAQSTKKLASVFGNILEHYDSALFGVLSPFIAPVFFSDSDPLIALMMTYLLIPLGMLMRPLGALFFGRIGDREGRGKALSISLIGVAISTLMIGLLPGYDQVGLLSPALLLTCRLLQGFFAAGETSGGAIYLLEKDQGKRADFLSAIFDSTTIVGIFLASSLTTLLAKWGLIESGWRYLFWIGGLVGLIGVYLRQGDCEKVHQNESAPNLFKAITAYWFPFLCVVITAGFSHATYTFPFVLMSGFIPLISPLTKTQLIEMNSYLLLYDLALLPLFGYLAHKIGRLRVMKFGAFGSAVTTPLAFMFFDPSSIIQVALLRIAIVTFGVAFAAAYHSFAVSMFPREVRYTLISLGSALGALFLGKPVAFFSLMVYQKTGLVSAVALYFTLLAVLATASIIKVRDRVYAT